MTPRFLADENCPSEIVAALRSDGFDVAWIVESAPGSIDSEVMARAATERRVLITEDKDFGDLAVRRRQASSGVCLLRLAGESMEFRVGRVLALVQRHGDRLSKSMTVVERERFRFRALFDIGPEDAT